MTATAVRPPASTPPAVRREAAALEAAELAGWRDLCAGAPPEAAAALGLRHADRGGAHVLGAAAAPGVAALNHALGLPADRPADEDDLAAVEATYAAWGLPAIVAAVAGSPLEGQLAARGYRPDYAWVKFARDVAPPRPVACDLAIRAVPPADGPRLAEVFAAFGLHPAFGAWTAVVAAGRPGWHCLGAYDGSRLVASGSLFAHGEEGWVTFGATDPAYRGRRAQKALLAARIALAADLGLRRLVIETGEPLPGGPDASYRNILGAGFRALFRRPFWRRTSSGGPPAPRP